MPTPAVASAMLESSKTALLGQEYNVTVSNALVSRPRAECRYDPSTRKLQRLCEPRPLVLRHCMTTQPHERPCQGRRDKSPSSGHLFFIDFLPAPNKHHCLLVGGACGRTAGSKPVIDSLGAAGVLCSHVLLACNFGRPYMRPRDVDGLHCEKEKKKEAK